MAPDDARALATRVEAACDVAPALTADLRLGGRVDGERIRGTLQVGVAADAIRLEGVPPFGAPIFLLAGRAEAATVLFVREAAYVRDAPVVALTEALVGVALAPDDLRRLLAGCGVEVPDITGGATFGAWTRLDAANGTQLWVQTGEGGRPVVRVVETADWRLDYAAREATAPLRGTLVASASGGRTSLSFEVVAPERLDVLPPAALELVIPPRARALTLADLRRQRVLIDS